MCHQRSGDGHELQKKQIKIFFLKKNAVKNIIMLQLSRANPGNPASFV